MANSAPSSVSFTEEMVGHVTFGETDCRRGGDQHRGSASAFRFRLTIRIPDVAWFVESPDHGAPVTGSISCEALGGERPVQHGEFNLFTDTSEPAHRRMRYRLFFQDHLGRDLTLSGTKEVKDEPGLDLWADTTTLYTRILRGHVAAAEDATAQVEAAGILVIRPTDFVRQMSTFRVDGPTFGDRVAEATRFGRFFFGALWDIYGVHALPPLALERTFTREVPLFTLDGVKDADVSVHPFTTADKLGLSMLRFLRAEADDVVVIIHGLTTSSDMFIMPEHYNLVSYLLDHGFSDVWCLDFRMSNRHPYNLQPHRWTMDDIALFDFPAALETVRRHVGDRRIHVICHCLGAVAFTMSLFGKALTGVTSVIANSAALTPRVPAWSHVKLFAAPFLLEYVLGFPYVNPRWAEDPGLTRGKVLSWLTGLFHGECDVPACHMLSLMWGSGAPALYSHENLHDITHRRGGDLYGGTSVHYYRHVLKMVQANNTAVKYDPADMRLASLPDNYFDHVRDITTPVLFMTGAQNHVFTDSNVECHRRLEELVPGRHQLHVFEKYGHQDPFMGKRNHVDIFPRLLRFLEEQRRRPNLRAVPRGSGNDTQQAAS